jgi:hypothetical protein
MLSYWIDLGFYFTTGGIAWRFPVALQMVFAIVMIALMASRAAGVVETRKG